MIRVLIVDDHSLVRAGVAEILRRADGVVVVGECADGSEVAGMAAQLLPDVVLMDVQMPIMSGIEATRDLLARQPNIRVLMLTGSISRRTVDEAVRAGAVGYILKGGDPSLLVGAVRIAAVGGTVWPKGEMQSPVNISSLTSSVTSLVTYRAVTSLSSRGWRRPRHS